MWAQNLIHIDSYEYNSRICGRARLLGLPSQENYPENWQGIFVLRMVSTQTFAFIRYFCNYKTVTQMCRSKIMFVLGCFLLHLFVFLPCTAIEAIMHWCWFSATTWFLLCISMSNHKMLPWKASTTWSKDCIQSEVGLSSSTEPLLLKLLWKLWSCMERFWLSIYGSFPQV